MELVVFHKDIFKPATQIDLYDCDNNFSILFTFYLFYEDLAIALPIGIGALTSNI